jgi:ribonucleotide monophosphatase NagD (HAD superfamily)
VHVHADIFGAGHKGRSFLEGLSRTVKTLNQNGRPFILRRITGNLGTGTHMSGNRVNQALARWAVVG